MSSNRSLSGKVAIITGSGRGIGAAIALKLASLGADVVINYNSNAEKANQIATKAKEHGVKALSIKADVSKKDEMEALFMEAKEKLSRIDIVMSNSGIEHFEDIQAVQEEEFDRVFDVNVKGQFFVSQLAHKYLEDNGRLILISSLSAVRGWARHAVYSASKAAIQGMVRSLAHDFGARNITVNCLAPGAVKTDMFAESVANYVPGRGQGMDSKKIEAMVSSLSPMNRPGEVEDVAGIVALLVSPEAQWITGQTIHANGGAYMV